MFERSTDRPRRVVLLALGEARMFNHSYIDIGGGARAAGVSPDLGGAR